jgi:hypothetical protein
MIHTRIALFALFSFLPLGAFAADPPVAADALVPAPVVVTQEAIPQRPPLLTGLYATSIALHAYDTYSTLSGLRGGAVELNPVMKPVVGNPVLFMTMKAAVAATTILSAEKLWRKGQRKQAIVVMVISNGLMAFVDAHNAATLRGQR